MSRKRNRSVIEIDDDHVTNLNLNGDWINENDGENENDDDDDEYMPIQTTTNPISRNSMMHDMNSEVKNDSEEYQTGMMSLRGLQSLGVNSLDVQTDVSIIQKKKAASSVLVILPGQLLPPHHTATDTATTMKHVKIGRIDGFHNIDGTSPNNNHLTLSLGTGTATTTNTGTSMSHEASTTETVTASTTTTACAPTLQFRGRSIPTTTTFVLLQITGGPAGTTTTATTPHKKSTKVIKPKIICKGVYNNVIVFGKGELSAEEPHVPSAASMITNSDPIIHVSVASSSLESNEIPSVDPLSSTLTLYGDIHIDNTQPVIAEDMYGTEVRKFPAIESSTDEHPKLLRTTPTKPSNTKTTKFLLPSTPLHHVDESKTGDVSIPKPVASKPKSPPVAIQSKRSNPSRQSVDNNVNVVSTTVTAQKRNAHPMSSKRHNRQQGPDQEQTIDPSPAGKNTAKSLSLTSPQTTDSNAEVTNQVLPDVTPLSQQEPLLIRTAVSTYNTGSSRKRRRTRNSDATTKSPGGNKKVIYTLDTDDDEFAFLGG